MKKLVIFDMDGLLIDTERIHDWSWKEAFTRSNLDIPTSERQTLMGLGHSHYMNQIRKLVGDDELADDVRNIQRDIYHGYFRENKPDIKAGVVELLLELRAKGVVTAVATSTRQASAEAYLRSVDLFDLFDYRIYGDLVVETKPNPALYNKVVSDLNINKENALILEDSYHGVKAANNAGIDVIWVKDFVDISSRDDISYLHSFDSLVEARETIMEIVDNYDMKEIVELIRAFIKERDWDQFHSPVNLAKSISIEAAELLECYQWSDDADVEKVKDELADIMIYALQLTDKYGLDIETVIIEKMRKNALKYEVSKAKGNSKKYTEL